MRRARSRRQEIQDLPENVGDWALNARILLASLVLTEPRTTASQRKLIRNLLASAKWIDVFKPKQSPWI